MDFQSLIQWVCGFFPGPPLVTDSELTQQKRFIPQVSLLIMYTPTMVLGNAQSWLSSFLWPLQCQ
ncbi:hypothetical protein BDV40DRAFT_260649 [Aspergillus tamarii]|uniref:Uncharacterized protein n=1 Tax=Aspergillus tamarii TaxID=41984 RepID=A0A5N6V178_ASPTM|nr:hypothetical protein BDV40DRAFT_260649 [Aspergillus tamarii]